MVTWLIRRLLHSHRWPSLANFTIARNFAVNFYSEEPGEPAAALGAALAAGAGVRQRRGLRRARLVPVLAVRGRLGWY